jgi:hypothetical protein
MGDVAFKGFQCLSPDCRQWIFVRVDSLTELFGIECEACGFDMHAGGVVKLCEYQLEEKDTGNTIESGDFTILVDDYIAEAGQYKYCIVCCSIKPLEMFDSHASRTSGRQGECRLCKKVYNGIKNQSRLPDQHREAAQKRRLYVELSGDSRIDGNQIRLRFGHKCFKCARDLRSVPDSDRPLDHTLPAYYLWPLTTENATLLCRDDNGRKAGSWPSRFYSDAELRRLAAITGIPYATLVSRPHFNPDALERLRDSAFVDKLLIKYAAYMDELIRLRNRVLIGSGQDFFAVASNFSQKWIRDADAQLPVTRD